MERLFVMTFNKQIEQLGDKKVIVMTDSELAALHADVGKTVQVGESAKRLTSEQKSRLMDDLLRRYDSAFRELAK